MGSNKAESLVRDLGTDLADSIGVREPGEVAHTPDPLAGLTRHKGTGLLPTDHIYVEDDQVRVETDAEADAQLTESVRRVGLLQPLRVRWVADVGKYCVVTGHRRLAAAVACGLDRVHVVIVEGNPTAAGTVEEQLIENLQRSALSPLDQSRAFRKYLDLTGCTAKELAQVLSLSPSKISRSLAILELPAEVQARVATGELTPSTASEIAKLKNPTVAAKVASAAAQERAPIGEVRKAVKQRRGVPAKATRVQPFTQFKISRGVAVLVRGKLDGTQVVAALEQALAQARAALATGTKASALEQSGSEYTDAEDDL